MDSLHFIETADQRDFRDSAAFLRGSPFIEGLTMSPPLDDGGGTPIGAACTFRHKLCDNVTDVCQSQVGSNGGAPCGSRCCGEMEVITVLSVN